MSGPGYPIDGFIGDRGSDRTMDRADKKIAQLRTQVAALEADKKALSEALNMTYEFLCREHSEDDPTKGEAFSAEARPLVARIADALAAHGTPQEGT